MDNDVSKFWNGILQPISLTAEIKGLLNLQTAEFLSSIGLPKLDLLLSMDIKADSCPMWWRNIIESLVENKLGRLSAEKLDIQNIRDFAWIRLFRFFSFEPENISVVAYNEETYIKIGRDLWPNTSVPKIHDLALKAHTNEVFLISQADREAQYVNSDINNLLFFVQLKISVFALEIKRKGVAETKQKDFRKYLKAAREKQFRMFAKIDPVAFSEPGAFWGEEYLYFRTIAENE